jgi:hypothetical protein
VKSRIFRQIALTALALCVAFLKGLSQEQLKMHNIDSIVSYINNSKFTETRDTTNNDISTYSIFMSTLETTISDGPNLKKYVHRVLNFDNSQKKIKTAEYVSTFYYNGDILIKVEESGDDNHGNFKVLWYFDDNKLIKFVMQPTPVDNDYYEKIKDREQLLKGLANGFLATFHLKHPSS